MKKKAILFLLLVLSPIFFLMPQAAYADGGLFIFQEDTWTLHTEDEQYAAINYENGMQKMIITVDVPTIDAQQAVWIFPVPSNPEDVDIDVASRFPEFGGKDLQENTKDNFRGFLGASFASQVHFSIPWSLYYTMLGGIFGSTPMQKATLGGIPSFSSDSYSGVEVYEQVEKYGLTSELISTKDSQSLKKYLNQKELDLDTKSSDIINQYIGQDYSFVVSWVSDLQQFASEKSNYKVNLGSFVTFPTDKMYYPLRLTSVYGNKKIPMNIYVMGHVSPEIFNEISDNTEINYFINYTTEGTEISDYKENTKYTKIEINTPSTNFVQDLWIRDKTPIKILISDFINNYFIIIAILLFALLSMLSSMLAGWLVYRKNNPNKLKFFLFGLWNFLTSFLFSITSFNQDIDLAYTNVNREKITNTSKIKPFLTAHIIGLIPVLLLINRFSADFGNLFSSSMTMGEYVLIIFMLFFLTPQYVAIPIWPYVWGWYYNRRLFYFNVLFSLVFLLFMYVLYFLSKLVLGF